MRGELHPGDRVRAKVRTIFGWKGTGTVIRADYGHITIQKDDDNGNTAEFARHELARLRRPRSEPPAT
jgi:hypothetical protein